jgi:hypothetical protein
VILVGSADSKSDTNISARYVLDIIGNDKLLFGDAFNSKTIDNLWAWNKVTVAIVDTNTVGGFQLKGDALDVGDEELVEKASLRLKGFGFSNSPQRIWTFEVKEIYSLNTSDDSKVPLMSA